MSIIKFYTRNILETGTVTVTGTPDTGFPVARLYDRDINLYWKDTVTEAKTFHVDQGGSDDKDVDFLAIPKHNFDGKTISWQYSENDADWDDAVAPWVQDGNDQIVKTLGTALNKRYWQVLVSSIANPYCSEIIMSYGYEFKLDWSNKPQGSKISNVEWRPTIGGLERSTKYGDRKRSRDFDLFMRPTPGYNDYNNFQSAMEDLDELSRPFFLKDHQGNYYLCRLDGDPREDYLNEGLTSIPISVIEMI